MSEYDDLRVKLRFILEASDYCKRIRGTDLVLAFKPAICEKCIEKGCKFFNICAELCTMGKKNK